MVDRLLMTFDGVDDAIPTPYADTGITSTGVFSYSCWVKYDSVANSMAAMGCNIQTNKTGVYLGFDTFSADRGHGGFP